VNYHFGDKAQLYTAVFEFCKGLTQSDNVRLTHLATLKAEDRIRGFIAWYMAMLFDTSRPAWAWQLFAREMVDPTPALDHMVETVIRPRMHMLREAIREIVGDEVPDQRVHDCIGSIMGQCLLYKHSLPVVSRLYPHMKFDAQEAVRLADHISQFSLAGLFALRDTYSSKPRSWRDRLCPKERAKRDASRRGSNK
jgi:AcrR family transcriptional regulator